MLWAWQATDAARVEITMNSVTSTMTLKNSGGDEVTADSQNGTTYVFDDLSAGDYTIWGYNSSNTLNGTFTFSAGDDDMEMEIFTITKISVSNSGWVYGTDYTIEDVEVHSREGATFPVTLGENAGFPSVLTYNGGSVTLRFVPSAARVAEGYIAISDGRTVTGNTNIQATMPIGGEFVVTCPKDAEVAVMQKPGGDGGTGTIHYVPFRVIAPESVETSGSTKIYTWRLGNGVLYNIRSWKTGGLTQLAKFYYSTDAAKRPVFNFTDADYEVYTPKWVDHDPKSLNGLNAADIMININEKGHLKMRAGGRYDLLAERVWQIIPDQTQNYFLEPDYNYAVYDINGNPDNSVIEVEKDGNIGSEWAIIRAKQAGTAIVTITYDAASAMQYDKTGNGSTYYGGRYFGALWPENTAVFVVSVEAPANSMDANMRINEEYNEDTKKNAGIYVDAEHDVFYYINGEETYNYTFRPTGVQTVEISYPTIRTNDAVYNTGWHSVAKNGDGSFTLPLKHGRQIVRMGDGTGKYEYQVLTAKHATRAITNETTGNNNVFRPGDNVKIQYDGLYHPANKLSGIYNMSAYVTYKGTPAGSAIILGSGQYWFASTPSAQAISFTIPADYEEESYEMTDGVLQVTGFGDPIGNHRTIDKVGGRSPNFTAISHQTYFGALPDAVIPVTQRAKTLATFALDPSDAVINSVKNSLGEEVAAVDGKYLLTEGENTLSAEKTGYKKMPLTIVIPAIVSADTVIHVALEAVPENGWDGTETTAPALTGNVYHITNGAELAWFAAQVTAGTGAAYNAVLDNDIDLSGFDWATIGTSTKTYKGTFDGNHKTISNLYINSNGTCLGLFGKLYQGAVVKDLTLRGTITSSSTSSSLKAGGVAGEAAGSQSKPVTISNVKNYVHITGHAKYAAGIVGYASMWVNIDRCANYGNVTLSHDTKTKATDAAGIAYVNSTNSTITNSYNCGTIVANNNVGGIYATSVNASVTNVYNTGRVHATRTNGSGYSCHGAIRPMANTTATTDQVTNAYANEDFLFNELNTIIVTDGKAWTGGEVAYKLGEAFGQEIGVDPLPVIGGMHVYELELPDGSKFYSNTYETYGEYLREGLTPGQMGTVCLPYASFRTFDATFYKVLHKELRDGTPWNITLEEVTELEPGVPYVFIPETSQLRIWYAVSTQVPGPERVNGLQGTFIDIADGAAGTPGNILEDNFVIYYNSGQQRNVFQRCGGNCSLRANRAYVVMDDVPLKGTDNAPQPVQGRRHIVIGNAQAPQTPTAVDNLLDGMMDNEAYDVLGRPVDIHNTPHGVYIINGKKIVK